ncbi:MAG: cell division protein FtsL [Rubrivivax sp.]|nr:cell division protein FtsL [Rubrivivax sp.]
MTRVQIVLLLALVASSLFLVRTSYENRRLFAANQKAEADGLRIQQEFKRLDAQRQINATNQRVARDAQAKLQMSTPVHKFDVYETPQPEAPR